MPVSTIKNTCVIAVSFSAVDLSNSLPLSPCIDGIVADETLEMASGQCKGFAMASSFQGIAEAHRGMNLHRVDVCLVSTQGYSFAENGGRSTVESVKNARFLNFKNANKDLVKLLKAQLTHEAANGYLHVPYELKQYPRLSLDGDEQTSILGLARKHSSMRCALARFAFETMDAHIARIPAMEGEDRIWRMYINPRHAGVTLLINRTSN